MEARKDRRVSAAETLRCPPYYYLPAPLQVSPTPQQELSCAGGACPELVEGMPALRFDPPAHGCTGA
jgi:hypothetical protein